MKNNWITILTGIGGSLLFLLLFYHQVVLNPNQYLFSDSGDGIKNYYSYAYHIKNDSSYVHFEGMNYPFGDLLQFADGQPAVSNTVKIIADIFPGVKEYSIGIINMLMLLSFVLGVVFLILILRFYKLPPWISIIVAIGIAGLSPQIFRMSGHLSLSYFFSFPVIWWLLLIDDQLKKIYFPIIAGLFNLIILFIHPYLALINASFVGLYLLVRNIERLKLNWGPILLRVFIIVVAPILGWKAYLNIYDHHVNRAEDVFYLVGNTSTLGSIFLPPYGFLNKVLNKIFIIDLPWEGWAYIGLVSIGSIVVYFLFKLLAKGKHKNNTFTSDKHFSSLKRALITAFIILLFSFGYPYRLGFEFLLEMIPALKQIRALGRFAWLFYYVVNVFSFVFLWHLLVSLINSKRSRHYVMVLSSLVILTEAGFYHFENAKVITSSENVFSTSAKTLFNEELFEFVNEYDLSNFQAIIPFPYFHIGGAEYSFNPGGENLSLEALALGYHTGLPLMASAMARSSETEARNNLSFLSYPWIKKDSSILNALSDQDFLILVSDNSNLSRSEKYWVDKSKPLYSSSHFNIYSFSKTNFSDFEIREFLHDNSVEHISAKDTFVQTGGKYLLPGHEYIKDELTIEGAKTGSMKDFNMLYTGFEYWFSPADTYNISFWYYNKTKMAHSNTFVIAEIDSEGNEEWTKVSHMRNTKYFVGDWSLMEYDFTIKPGTRSIKIFMKSWSDNEEKIWWRDVLLREIGTDVYFGLDKTLYFNNYRIPYN